MPNSSQILFLQILRLCSHFHRAFLQKDKVRHDALEDFRHQQNMHQQRCNKRELGRISFSVPPVLVLNIIPGEGGSLQGSSTTKTAFAPERWEAGNLGTCN